MAWTLVTPAPCGIGLALARHLLITTPPSLPVVATARSNPSDTKARILDGSTFPFPLLPPGSPEIGLDSESSIADIAAYCKDRYNNRSKSKAAHLRRGLLVLGMLIPE